MNRNIFISFGLHIFLVIIMAMSLPFLAKKPIDLPPIISVELIQITDKTNIPFAPKAKKIIEKVKEKEKMSEDLKSLKLIKEIGKKMEDSISEYFYRAEINDPTVNFTWEYILIDNKKIKNAWCMPGGKIAVYTGILDVTKNKNGLAAVMGHEIAHAVAKHSVERASQAMTINLGTTIADIFLGGAINRTRNTVGQNTGFDIFRIGIFNPFGRKQETEADYLGLIFSSLAGYDIREAAKLWERMSERNKGKEPPQFMSTHTSSKNRIINIKSEATEIITKYPPIRKI